MQLVRSLNKYLSPTTTHDLCLKAIITNWEPFRNAFATLSIIFRHQQQHTLRNMLRLGSSAQPFCLCQHCRVWSAYALPGCRFAATVIVIKRINVCKYCIYIYICMNVYGFVCNNEQHLCEYNSFINNLQSARRVFCTYKPLLTGQTDRQTDGQPATEAEPQALPTDCACLYVCNRLICV